MTNNTIPNVPRELLERAWRALANSATGREIGAYLDADPCAPECAETCARAAMCSTCSAVLSAPSPAGVDGLEVFITDCATCIDVVPAKTVTDARVVLAKDAQAIIDGLRGDVEVMTQHANNYSRMFEECAEERDQHAQRIGELEGLLREVRDTYRAAIHWEDLRGTMKRIDAALSAGKDSAP